jgi:hypothetical protein
MLFASAIHLHDSVRAHALREILVRRPDRDLLHPSIGRSERRGRRERVVGLELDHRPYRDSHRSRAPSSSGSNCARSVGSIPSPVL